MTNKLPVLLLMCAFSTGALAEFVGPGDSPELTTIKLARMEKHDAEVALEGHIVKKIKAEHYLFKDDTGVIEVEIDNKDFRDIKVTPKTKIRIVGEIDKKWNATTIDIDFIELAK